MERRLARIDKKELALKYESDSVDALIEDLDEVMASLDAISRRKLTVDPSVRRAAGELREQVRERQQALEVEAKAFKELQDEETAYQTKEAQRRTKIAELEAKVKNDTANRGHKAALTRIKALSDAETRASAARQAMARARAPDLFRELKGASRDVDRVGNSLLRTAKNADSWGSKFDALSGLLTRLTPVLRGLALVIGADVGVGVHGAGRVDHSGDGRNRRDGDVVHRGPWADRRARHRLLLPPGGGDAGARRETERPQGSEQGERER